MGRKIFDELKLLEYYKDLEIHDQRIKSMLPGKLGKLPRPVLKEDEQSQPSIKCSFLEDWDDKLGLLSEKSLEIDGDTKEITKAEFLDLFYDDYYESKRESLNKLKVQDYENLLKKAEDHWNIRQGVADAWSKTFDKLLGLYNTQDIRTVINTFTMSENGQHRKDNRISMEELKRWFHPKLNPPYWKKIFMPSEYEREKQINQTDFEFLSKALKPDELGDKVTKAEFIDGIMTELRKGEIMVRPYVLINFIVLLNLVLIQTTFLSFLYIIYRLTN